MRSALAWGVGGGLIALSVLIVYFNVTRHVTMSRARRAGHPRNISGVVFLGSLFFLVGWRISPLPPHPLVFLVLLFEIPAVATFSSASEAPSGSSDDDGKAPGGPSA